MANVESRSRRNPSGRTHHGKKKIAILGGGPSGLTCAYYLTSDPKLREKYDITVYTLGWRLGGKGASGRAGEYDKIEEHGLHLLFGGYHSFFRTIRDCYERLDRPPGHPLRTWRDAFKPSHFGVWEDRIDRGWDPWALVFPRNSGIPGDRGVALSSRDYIAMAIQGSVEMIFGWRALEGLLSTPLFAFRGRPNDRPDLPVKLAIRLIKRLIVVSHDVAVDLEKHDRLLLRLLRWMRGMAWPMARRLSQTSVSANRFWLSLDFLAAFLTGIIRDGVLLEGGFAKIDHLDFREWLAMHGAHPASLEGPLGKTIYDAAFSYELGEAKEQRIAAGVGVRLMLAFGMYRGDMYYKMQAGMGDTVFAPMYQELKRRGVKFEFFHKVESLHLSEDRCRIQQVRMVRQAKLAPGVDEYDPLIDVKGLECWPAEPRYEQLEHGDELRGCDLESYYQRPPHAHQIPPLEAGVDFDTLVFGIPIGAVPLLCDELVNHDERWKAMVENVVSVQTLAFQTWAKRDLDQLGWTWPSPLLSLYVEPLNTWADMSQVIPQENWPEELEPKNISYFCGAQPGPKYAPHPDDDPDFEKRMFAAAKRAAIQYMNSGLLGLMPKAVDSAGAREEFDWSVLVDPENRVGEARFDAQYWRSNCGPSERVTLATPGSIRHRMEAGDTGYENLVITGDWIDNGLYAACMEGAFNAGILAARAVSGWPFEIDGLGFSVTRGPLHPPRAGRR